MRPARRFLLGTAALAAALAVVTSAPAARETLLVATVGPGPILTLEFPVKGPVKRLKPGRYFIAVRDRSNIRNFHLKGPGVDRKTPVKRVHGYGWHLVLRKGVYRYYSDPQRRTMHATFRVT